MPTAAQLWHELPGPRKMGHRLLAARKKMASVGSSHNSLRPLAYRGRHSVICQRTLPDIPQVVAKSARSREPVFTSNN
jgi:hypothetical protein